MQIAIAWIEELQVFISFGDECFCLRGSSLHLIVCINGSELPVTHVGMQKYVELWCTKGYFSPSLLSSTTLTCMYMTYSISYIFFQQSTMWDHCASHNTETLKHNYCFDLVTFHLYILIFTVILSHSCSCIPLHRLYMKLSWCNVRSIVSAASLHMFHEKENEHT